MRKYGLIFLIAVPVFLIAEKNDTDTTFTKETFVKLYVELSISAEKFLGDSALLAHIQDSIFASFHTTRDKFNAFRNKMDENPAKWKDVWEAIIDELEKREKEARQNKSTTE